VGVILLWVCVFPRESQNPVGVALLYSYCRTGNSVWLWALPPRPPALTDTAPQTTPTESGLQTANRSVPRTCSTSARAPAPSRVTRDALYARGVGAPYPPLSSPLCAGRPLWPGLTLKQGALADCPVWGQRPNHQVPPSGTRLSGRFGCAARIGHCGLPEGGQGLMCTVSAKVTSCTLCMAPRLSLSLRSIDRRCDL
jgi:hypothetical protein